LEEEEDMMVMIEVLALLEEVVAEALLIALEL
jgi:hypothetical protein